MRYLHIWGCPVHVLKRKFDKLEAKTEVCMFLGYSKETKGYLFYNHKDNKVFVSTHAKFLEDDYMNNFDPRNKVVLAEMNEPVNEQPMDETRVLLARAERPAILLQRSHRRGARRDCSRSGGLFAAQRFSAAGRFSNQG